MPKIKSQISTSSPEFQANAAAMRALVAEVEICDLILGI